MERIGRKVLAAGLVPVLMLTGVAHGHHLDGANTQLSFEIERFGVHWFSVDFRELSGDFAVGGDAHGGALSVAVRTNSVDTRSAYWNERLRSAQYLDSERFPQMTFRSSGIDLQGSSARIQGELTLHGITRPLELALTEIDCPPAQAGASAHCRFVGRGTLRRSDFGIAHGFWSGGDLVEVIVRGH